MNIFRCKPLLYSVALCHCEDAVLHLIEEVLFLRFEDDTSAFICQDASFGSNYSVINFDFPGPILRALKNLHVKNLVMFKLIDESVPLAELLDFRCTVLLLIKLGLLIDETLYPKVERVRQNVESHDV